MNQFKLNLKQQAEHIGAIVREFRTRRKSVDKMTWLWLFISQEKVELARCFKLVLRLSSHCKNLFVSVRVLNLTLKVSLLSFRNRRKATVIIQNTTSFSAHYPKTHFGLIEGGKIFTHLWIRLFCLVRRKKLWIWRNKTRTCIS